MGLLEFAAENHDSDRIILRLAAAAACFFLKWQADSCERRLERKGIALPEDADPDQMLARIKEKIREK